MSLAWIAAAVGGSPAYAQSSCGAEVLATELASNSPGPRLWTPDGAPTLGAPFSLQVTGGPLGAPGVLALGPNEQATFVDAFSAVLFPAPPWTLVAFALDGAGASPKLLELPVVPSAFCGAELVVQAAVLDAGAPGGARFSNGLRLRVGEHTGPLFHGPDVVTGGGGVIRDLDHDGLLDTVGAGNAELIVRRGNGDLTFAPPDVYAGGPSFGLAVEDFTLDGELDVVGMYSVTLRLMAGGGDGSFGPATTVSLGSLQQHLAAGDVDADGRPDVVILDKSKSEIRVAFGTGSTFVPTPGQPADDWLAEAHLGDWNLDGMLDALTTHTTWPGISFFQGAGDGTLSLYGSLGLSDADRLAVGDVDADGAQDLVLSPKLVVLGTGDGGFQTVPPTGGGVPAGRSVLLDLDGDGLLDLVHAHGKTSLALGTGTGVFDVIAEPYLPGVWPELDDLDGDGDLDLLMAGQSGGSFGATQTPPSSLYENLGDLNFGDFGIGGGAVMPIATELIDLNADGILDIVSAGEFVELRSQLGIGSGYFGASHGLTIGLQIYIADFGDLTGDGVPDALLGSSDLLTVVGAGDGKFVAPPLVTDESGGGYEGKLSDLNADGELDLVQAHGNGLRTLLGAGDGTLVATGFATHLVLYHIAVHDLDVDGLVDVVGSNVADLAFLRGNGDGTLANPVVTPLSASAGWLQVVDLGGDGLPDLLTAKLADETTLRLLHGIGDGTFQEVPSVTGNIRHANARDLNGDGIVDLVTNGNGSLALYLGDATGAFHLAESYSQASQGDVALADFDEDGNVDVGIVGSSVRTFRSRIGEP